MAILSIAVFGTALVASVWTIWATIAPRSARIIDLLVNGPEYAPRAITVVATRSAPRDVSVRRIPVQVPASPPLRAAA